ncbi:protein of unknown function [Pseudogulbenkiania sp. NH8B]|nr:protein of unknown function [Pseudogulbenkiania sp. NH8B]BAK76915.1 protein of unknown function [Pseudogulbenkiania sp. NH8B]
MYEIKSKAKHNRERYTGGMCVNFIPPTRQQLLDLFDVEPPQLDWPLEVWQDYIAPIIIDNGSGPHALLANYGFVPKRHMPLGIRLSTMNARAETIGQLRTYNQSWHAGRRCLVPMQFFFEPCYESGKAERWRIGLASGQPFAVAGIWRAWPEEDGSISHAFSQVTINADDHPLMRRMHKPGDEKRNLVIIEPEHYQDWLACRDPEIARSCLTNYPAEQMLAEPAPKTNKAPPTSGTLDLFS